MIGTRTKIYFISINYIFEDHDIDETEMNKKWERQQEIQDRKIESLNLLQNKLAKKLIKLSYSITNVAQ